MNQKKLFLVWLLALLLFGCTPSGSDIETTISPTEAAKSTSTFTFEPTSTLESTSSPESTPTNKPQQTFMDKLYPEYIRLMDYNVNWDSIFPDNDPLNHEWRTANKADAFRRLIRAINPDIVCLQEINPARDPKDVSTIFDEVLPLENSSKWQAVIDKDTLILSRYSLKTDNYRMHTTPNQKLLSQTAALVDLPDDEYKQKDIYLICAHFDAFEGQENIYNRQMQADMIMHQVADLKTPGDNIDLVQGTPYILAGDFNVYDTDPAYHLTTLITGDIVNENLFGEDIQPDWDDTPLTDAKPSHNGRELQYYTWREDGSGFTPGILDRVIYSDSVITARYSIILNTEVLSLKNLLKYELQTDDVMMNGETEYFDHLPIVIDFDLNN